jgi:hypothetical protein
MKVNQMIAIACITCAIALYFSEPGQIGDPLPGEGLRSLTVIEADDQVEYPAEQLAAIQSATFRKELQDKGWSIKMLDQDLTRQGEPWQQMLEMPRPKLPWLYISNDKRSYSGPYPNDIDQARKLFDDYHR